VRNIILLGLTSFFTDVASEMVYPLLPLFLTSTLGAGPAILGLIEGVAESLASLLRVVSGYASDRIGRRKDLTIAGYGASVVGKGLLFAATGWGWVFAGRLVDRVGKGIRTAPRDAIIADSSTEETRGRAFGLHRSMDTAGAVLGVLAAILILRGGSPDYASVFLWSLLPATLGLGFLLLVREGAVRQGMPGTIPAFQWNRLPRPLRVYLVITLVFALGNSSNTFLLLRTAGTGASPTMTLLAYLVYNVTSMTLASPAGRMSDRIGRGKLLAAGYGVYALVYFGFGALDAGLTHWTGWTLFAVYGIYSGLTEGVERALVADLSPPSLRATAIGIHATVAGITLLPASIIAGLLWEHVGPAAPFYFGGGLALIASASVLIGVRR
jgi:MFS family permease